MIRRGGVFDLDSMEMALEQAFHQAQPGAIAIVDTTLNTPYSFMVRGIPRSPIDTAQLIIIDENGSFASAQMRFDGVGNIGDFRFRVTTSSTFSNVSITTNVSDGLTAGFSVQTAGTSTYYIPQAIMDSVEHAIFRVSVAAASSSGCQTQLWEFNFADKPTVSNDSENVISASLVDGGAYLDGFTDGGEAGGADRTLGNTDNFDLGLKVNNVIAMYLQNDGNVGFGTITPDKTIGISDGTDEFGISVDAGEWKLWNDAGTPVSKLSVDSTGRAALNAAIVSNIQFGIKSSSTNTFIQRWTSSDNHQLANFLEDGATGGRWDIYNSANAVKIRFYPGGNNSYFTDTQVGFGTTTPDSATVQIATGIDTYDLYIGQTTPYSKVTAGSGWVTSSDTTKKKNLVPVETLISKNQIAQKILNTGVYRFQWKEESLYVPFDSTNVSMWDSLTVSEKLFQKEGYMIKEWKRAQRAAKKKNFGFAAQEYGANFEGDPNTKEINWQKITVIQWYAIQQLIKQNQQQNQKLNDLEARILALEKMH